MNVIGLITDFGTTDPYVGVMKAVIYAHGFKGYVIDVCHNVMPFSIEHAQYMLATSYKYFPHRSIFIVVIDPGVGTSRNILLVEGKEHYFLMPDNGIIGCIQDVIQNVYCIDTSAFPNASSTFHGRDIFAVVAARLATEGITGICCWKCTDYKVLPFPFFKVENNTIVTKVAHVDRFGNCILSLPNEMLMDSMYSIKVRDTVLPLVQCNTYAQLESTTIGILRGSCGFVEIAMNQNSCSSLLQITIGDKVEIVYA